MLDAASWETKTILYLLCNPKSTSRLRLDEEVREALESLRSSQHSRRFVVEICWATRIKDMRRALIKTKPQLIIFSGHSNQNSQFIFEDEKGDVKITSPEKLADLFSLFSRYIECILCNACYSSKQAKLFSHYVDYSIGFSDSVNDNAAIEFSQSFIDSISSGLTYDMAYKVGCSSIEISGFAKKNKPLLFVKEDTIKDLTIEVIQKNITLLKNKKNSIEQRRLIINKTLELIQKIPHNRYSDSWYPDALNDTWLFICENIQSFEFEQHLEPQKSLSNWINSILSRMMKRRRREQLKYWKNESPIDDIRKDSFFPAHSDIFDELIIEYENQKNKYFFTIITDYILEDIKSELTNCVSKKCSQCNCQYLSKKRLIEQLEWKEISENLTITTRAAREFFKKCLKILMDKLKDMGYKDIE